MTIQKIADYVTSYYAKNNPVENVYHDISHVKNVVKIATDIGRAFPIGQNELHILKIAAWFHDIGHIEVWEGHEERSFKKASEFLQSSYSPKIITEIGNLILATKLHHHPQNYLEETIKDADLNYLGSDQFFVKINDLKSEIEIREQNKIDTLNWLKINIDFFNAHSYYTKYAKDNFDKTKSANLIKLKELYGKEIKMNSSLKKDIN